MVVHTTGSSTTARPWSSSSCRFSQPRTVAVLRSAGNDPSAFWQRVNLTEIEPDLVNVDDEPREAPGGGAEPRKMESCSVLEETAENNAELPNNPVD